MPFATIQFQLERGVSPFELRQLVGNMLLLLPLGIYGPMLAPALRALPGIILAGAGLSALIELGQLAIASVYGFPVRVADIDDVLLNTSGVLVGYLGWRTWARMPSVDSRHAVRRPADR